jgi:hypothetical protein
MSLCEYMCSVINILILAFACVIQQNSDSPDFDDPALQIVRNKN